MKKLLMFCFMIPALWTQGQNVKYYSDKSLSYIAYFMNHPFHSWTGVNKDVTSIILSDEKKTNISKVVVSAKIASFDSQNANRDSHVIEAAEGVIYPNVTFSSSSIANKGDSLEVTGQLTFHGVTRTISFNAFRLLTNKKTEVKGTFSILMTQYNISPPTLLALPTDDEVKISFDMYY